MKQPCGCCAGLELVTPEQEANRPGLSALAYRAGTYASFLESMLARLSTFYLDVQKSDGDGAMERIYPLRGLTTRDLNDPSIALLDAWATVADVLTFYEERIANEGYLRTAVERRSILELARLVGYRMRPGVSSSVYLAFTVNDDFDGIIPAGTRAQSLPGPGEKPQPFETYEDLPAKGDWNTLKPRVTRPQIVTFANDSPQKDVPFEPDFDARTRDTLYFKGISTNLKVGDAILIVAGDKQVQRFVEAVDVQANYDRTEVVLQEPPLSLAPSTGDGASQALFNLHDKLDPFLDGATSDFPGAELAAQVLSILTTLVSDTKDADTATAVGRAVEQVVPQIEELHQIAAKRKFTRLEPWLADLLDTLNFLVQNLPQLDGETGGEGTATVKQPPFRLAPSGLARLDAILNSLAKPPSLQPGNALRLIRPVARVFAPQSDIAPRLISTLRPEVAPLLYPAWGKAEPVPSSAPVKVFALRSKTAPFGNNAPARPIVPKGGGEVSYEEWTFEDKGSQSGGTADGPTTKPKRRIDLANRNVLFLESNNEKIVPGSWVVLQPTDPTASPLVVKVMLTQSASRADYLISAKVTKLTLSQDWIPTTVLASDDITILRTTTVWAQSELLELAEEPLDRDVEGDTIELDGLYDGLESGRWIVVSGSRTDIPNVTGATSSELVMIGSVNQGPGKESCLAFSTTTMPFRQIYYVTEPTESGDRLVVGRPTLLPKTFLDLIPNPKLTDQQICDPIQLAPGFYANVYVPTKEERTGVFSVFADHLFDPRPDASGKFQLFEDATIPGPRQNPNDPDNPTPVFAMRIASLASGSETVHTRIVLANKLAYKYDAEKVAIYANVVKATHGQTQGEVLGNGDASQPFQRFALHQFPLTYLPAPTPSGAESTLAIRVNEIKWHEAANLFVLGSSDRDYITQTDDSEKTSVITGNGEHGLRVPSGTGNVKAIYRSGAGKAGNVEAQQVSQMATQPLGVKSVINPLRASGGADADTRDQARRNIPIGVTALDRLVSVADYVDFARRFAGIGKASARRLTDGRRIIVHLTIAGKDDVPIDQNSDLYTALVQALAAAGDPHQPVQIALRRLKVLVISAGIKIKSDYVWETVAAKLRAALLDLYSFDRRELGQPAFLSEAVSTMQSVAGVLFADVQTFDSVSESVTAEQLTTLAADLQRHGAVDAELASVNTLATESESRILPAELAVLTPDIPDTLILTEITK